VLDPKFLTNQTSFENPAEVGRVGCKSRAASNVSKERISTLSEGVETGRVPRGSTW